MHDTYTQWSLGEGEGGEGSTPNVREGVMLRAETEWRAWKCDGASVCCQRPRERAINGVCFSPTGTYWIRAEQCWLETTK